MDSLVFNEYSLPKTRAEEKALLVFFQIYKQAKDAGIIDVRVSPVYKVCLEIPLANGRTVRDWIQTQSRDMRMRLKEQVLSMQTCDLFQEGEEEEESRHEWSSFTYEGENVPVLGVAYLCEQLILSVNTDAKWDKESLTLHHDELVENADKIQPNEVEVANVATVAHLDTYIQKREAEIAQNCGLASEISSMFPHIVLNKDPMKMFDHYKYKVEVWQAFAEIDRCMGGIEYNRISLAYLKKHSGVDMSDESDSVKNNDKLNRHRNFPHGTGTKFFGYHLKLLGNKCRVHFIIDKDDENKETKIVIGYIGKHLPT